ncbi:MAG: hypothetical protein LBJ14_08400 [Desulfarculales bacterium]|jgi:phenylpyruvate tautomerase PptA (4-oxalocrotonate tautomerase family)|nr:hypothetical protein [Desulfarculales bacterium]
MPYINVTTSRILSPEQKKTLSGEFGAIIHLLPNKTEKVLMMDFCDGHSLFFSGREMSNGAYVDVRIYGFAGYAQESEFTEKVYALLRDNLGLKENEVYVTIGQYRTWGSGGKLK